MEAFSLLLQRLAIAFLLLLPISALGSKYQLWHYEIGIALCAIALVGSLLIEIICAIWLMQKPTPKKRNALRLASLFALPPLIIIATIMRDQTSGIMLHDISTDLENPPTFTAAVALRGKDSNTLNHSAEKLAAQSKLYPHVSSLKNNHTQQENYQAALMTAEQMGWEIHYKKPQAGHIEAIATSFWFGFKDDIVIRAQNHRVDLRSISRVGESDLGANARRIEQFLLIFPANLAD